eukprot:GHVP01008583.1.p1 GENE.GHVP01008583.1~~GHVP01008583.1.p1  ORF type:complete len:101 (+),score=25.95 GHVP01008583.1:77-379(+)
MMHCLLFQEKLKSSGKIVKFEYPEVQKPENLVQGRIKERARDADSSEEEEGENIAIDSLPVVDSIFDMLSDGTDSDKEEGSYDDEIDSQDDTFEVVEVPL